MVKVRNGTPFMIGAEVGDERVWNGGRWLRQGGGFGLGLCARGFRLSKFGYGL